MSLRMLFSGLTVLVFCLMVAVQAESRTSTDWTGKFQAEPEFVRLSGDTVYLKKPNGATVAVPLNRLSPADQRFARQAAATAPAGRGRGSPSGNASSDPADSRQTARKYALLSAVNRYRHDRMNDSKLEFPEADAAAVAELLRGSGYTVDLLLGKNATRQAIQDALEKAGRQGTDGGAVLLGFFGHGVQYGDLAYYGPYDTSVRIVKVQGRTVREDDGRPKLEPDPESMVSMRTILDALTACGASNRILLADCCREDPSRARGRAFGSTLTTRDLPPGTVALFACSKDEQAFEHDDWEHGAFTYAFLQHSSLLARSGKVLSGTLSDKLFESVKDMVEDKTDERYTQTVYSLSSGTVDFQITSAVNLPKRVDVPVRPTPGTPPRPVTGRKAGDEIADNGLNMKFCWIPPGTFTMGSPQSEEGRDDDDEKQVRVTRQGRPQHRCRV